MMFNLESLKIHGHYKRIPKYGTGHGKLYSFTNAGFSFSSDGSIHILCFLFLSLILVRINGYLIA